MALSRHTVGVEKLRTIDGFERVNHMVTAVVERSGSHVKVCITSVPVRNLEGQSMHRWHGNAGRTVAEIMDNLAQGVAGTYGAEHVPAIS